jgi:cytochrome P450 family 109
MVAASGRASGSCEWSPSSQDTGDDRFTELARLRGRCPVVHSGAHGGFWAILAHGAARAALRDAEGYRSGQPFVGRRLTSPMIPLATNRPEHTRYRRFLQPYFAPRAIDALAPLIRERTIEHVAPFVAAGGGDAITGIAGPLPARVLCAFLGIPDSCWTRMKAITDRTHRELVTDRQIDEQFLEIASEVVAARQHDAANPATDLISGLLTLPVGERQLTTQEIAGIVVQLIAAGHSTTTRAASSVLHAIAADPALQRRLRTDPACRDSFIEEVLRLAPPLHMLGRETSHSVAIGGQTIPAGEVVGIHFGAANRDPSVFNDPESLDLDRASNPHLTFGLGIHVCLGATLARRELRIMLDEFLTWTQDAQLADSASAPATGFQSGYLSLPLQVTRAEPQTPGHA